MEREREGERGMEGWRERVHICNVYVSITQ